jgi:lipopolysaccharide export LptBFGC system permease protein LptF
MTTLIKLAYAGAITVLLILVVAFGTRVVYEPPAQPRFEDFVGRSPVRVGPDGAIVPLTPEEQARQEEEQRRYREAWERHEDERAEYRRNVFLIAAVFGLVALAAGISLDPRLDAMRLGLILGGVGTLLYGIAQAGGELGRVGPAVLFVVALVGLALVLAAGYRWLTRLEHDGDAG